MGHARSAGDPAHAHRSDPDGFDFLDRTVDRRSLRVIDRGAPRELLGYATFGPSGQKLRR